MLKPYRVLSLLLLTTLGVAAAACDDDGEGDDTPAPDAMAAADAGPPDATPPPDAMPMADGRPADITCLGETPPPPGTPPDPLSIAGNVVAITASGQVPIVGATVTARKGSDDSVVATAESGVGGAYVLSVPTGGVALSGYLHASAVDHVATNLFPPSPTDANVTGLNVTQFPTSLLSLLQTLAGVTVEKGTGIILMRVADCADDSVIGATVSFTGTPEGNPIVLYGGEGMPIPDANQLSTGSSGLVYIFNVQPGSPALKVEYLGSTLRTSPFKTFADEASFGLAFP